jgi:hypothetical protein
MQNDSTTVPSNSTVAPLSRLRSFVSQYFSHGMSVVSHMLFGLHPVFSRYLQHTMAHPIPALSLISAGFGSVIAIYLPKILYKIIRFIHTKMQNEKLNKELMHRLMRVIWTDFIKNWRVCSALLYFNIISVVGLH